MSDRRKSVRYALIAHHIDNIPVPAPKPSDSCFIVPVASAMAGLATSELQISSSEAARTVAFFTTSTTSSCPRQTATFMANNQAIAHGNPEGDPQMNSALVAPGEGGVLTPPLGSSRQAR